MIMLLRLNQSMLSMAILIATATAALAQEEAVSEELATPPSLPFELPELPDDAPESAAPPAAGAIAPPPTGHNVPVGAGLASPSHSLAGATNEDIRDVRGPISVPVGMPWAWITMASVAVLGGLVAGWLYLRRHSSTRAKLAYEIAFEQLERARSLMQPEQAREFSIQVSEAVRTYIDQRFELGATHCTSEEFLAGLLSDPHSPLQIHTEALQDFLGHCDLAKFAGFSLAVPQMEAMHASAWRLVDETRPRPNEDKNNQTAEEERSPTVRDSVPALAAGGAS
jgi:hypothetical protein